MKHLYLIRHAKSSWDHPHLEDMKRPLSNRGKQDAPFMGNRLREMGVQPDLIISSPAKRAYKTARKIAKQVSFPRKKIIINDQIYLNGSQALFNLVKGLDEQFKTVFLVGHNPDITSLAYLLTHHRVDNIPTCGIFYVSFDVIFWHDITEGSGAFQFFDYPKKHI